MTESNEIDGIEERRRRMGYKNPSIETLHEIQLRYETNVPLNAIARQFGFNRNTILKYAKRDGWRRDPSQLAQQAQDAFFADALRGSTTLSHHMPKPPTQGGKEGSSGGSDGEQPHPDHASRGMSGAQPPKPPTSRGMSGKTGQTGQTGQDAQAGMQAEPPSSGSGESQQPGKTGKQAGGKRASKKGSAEADTSFTRWLYKPGEGPSIPFSIDQVEGGRSASDTVIPFPRLAFERAVTDLSHKAARPPDDMGPSEAEAVRTQIALAGFRALMAVDQLEVLNRHRDVLSSLTAAFTAFLDPQSVVDKIPGSKDWPDAERLEAQQQVSALALRKIAPCDRDSLSGTLKALTDSLMRSITMQRQVVGLPTVGDLSVAPASSSTTVNLFANMPLEQLQAAQAVIRTIEGEMEHKDLPKPPGQPL